MADRLALADWRRQVAELYAHVRALTDAETAWCAWRERRDNLFRQHPQSPIAADAADFGGLPYFAYDPALRFVADICAAAGDCVTWPTGGDGTVTGEPVARTGGLADRLGAELTVYWLDGYGGGVFLPFGDATNGATTYGGGRYLLDGIKGADLGMADGRLILDFNFAYNPSCAYSSRWVCPLTPKENRLPAAIEAGEKASAAV